VKPRRFIELTCGGAAVSISLLGGERARPLVGWRGSKAKYAPAILDALGLAPGMGAESVHLNDAGGWGNAWKTLTRPDLADRVADTLDRWAGSDQEEVWRLATASNDWANGEDAARWLIGIYHSILGAPPSQGGRPGNGFRQDAGNGKPADLRSLSRKVRSVSRTFPHATFATQGDANTLTLPSDARGWYVYIDPPYRGTEGYAHDLSPAWVSVIAKRWATAGATVGVSEGIPLLGLGRGWRAVRVTTVRSSRTQSSKSAEEWVTVYHPPAG
jgi:hypothetical protein